MNNTKKILSIVLVLLAVTLPSSSQSLRDYLKSRSGKVDSLVLNAVSPALSIIRQQYRLERNGDFFGRQNKPYFAETYSLGINVSDLNGTLIHRSVVFPWEGDSDYQRINGNGKYRPAYFRSMRRIIMEKEWSDVELELGTQYVTPITQDSLLYKHAEKKADFGLPIDETAGMKQGYMIWVYSSTNLQDSAMQVQFEQTELKVEANPDGKPLSLNLGNIKNILGGIFIVPQVERAGYIKLLLVGVAAKNSKGEWSLSLMTSKSGELTKVDESGKGDKSRKKKKRSASDTTTEDKTVDPELTPIK